MTDESLVELAKAFCHEVNRSFAPRSQGGQTVHDTGGDFRNSPPSVRRCLEIWARSFSNAFEDDIIKLKRDKREHEAFVILVDVVSKGLYRDVRDLDMPPETRTRLLSWCRQLEATFYPSKQ